VGFVAISNLAKNLPRDTLAAITGNIAEAAYGRMYVFDKYSNEL